MHAMFEEYRSHIKDEALKGDPMLFLTVNGMHPNRIGQYIIASDLSATILPLIPAR